MPIFNLDDRIVVDQKEYRVTGIDRYTLLNLYEQTKKWDSYTLLGKAKNKIWLASGLEQETIIWESANLPLLRAFNDFKFDPERSGFAIIDFDGDSGVSTPLAEVQWFNNISKRRTFVFFVIEKFFKKPLRLTNISTYFYTGRKDRGNIRS